MAQHADQDAEHAAVSSLLDCVKTAWSRGPCKYSSQSVDDAPECNEK
jgi:hypothetical protein